MVLGWEVADNHLRLRVGSQCQEGWAVYIEVYVSIRRTCVERS